MMVDTHVNEFSLSTIEDDSLPWERKDQKSIELKSLFFKWNLLPDFLIKSFRVSGQIQSRSDEERIIKQMFSDPTVQSSIETNTSDIWQDELKLNVAKLSCTVLNMKFFDKVVDVGLVSDSDSGYIRGCYDEEIDGIMVQDMLRRMCARDNAGEEFIFNEEDRNEFIFHLLKLVSIGGAKCQVEDKFHKLRDATTTLYKEVLQVERDPCGAVKIKSSVYEISILGENNVFPFCHSVHNKCYAIFSGQKITLMIKRFTPFW